MPGLLPQAVVPPPSFCCSAGLQGSPPCCSRAPQVENAQKPLQSHQAWRIAEGLVRTTPGGALPHRSALCALQLCLTCPAAARSPQPGAASLFPVLEKRAPRALLHTPLPAPSGREGSGQWQGLAGGSAPASWGGCVTPHTLVLSPATAGQAQDRRVLESEPAIPGGCSGHLANNGRQVRR